MALSHKYYLFQVEQLKPNSLGLNKLQTAAIQSGPRDAPEAAIMTAKPDAAPLVAVWEALAAPAPVPLRSYTSTEKQQNSDGVWKHLGALFVVTQGSTGAWTMSDGRSEMPRADRVKFIILIATFVAASFVMALRLPA